MLRSSRFWIRAFGPLVRSHRHGVRQTTQSDCGVACTLMVMARLGRDADPVQAVATLDPDRTGSSLAALRAYFTDTPGLEAQALKVPAATLADLTGGDRKSPNPKGQLIAHMTQQHYVWVLHADDYGVLVYDPAMGPVLYPFADFVALYSGAVLRVTGATQPRKRGTGWTGWTGWFWHRLGLVLSGMASRLLEMALILSAVVIVYMVLNHASFPALLMAFAIVAGSGAMLILTRQIRAEGEAHWLRKTRNGIGSGLLRAAIRGRDLQGFRGRSERDVSGAIRRGLGGDLPQRVQLPATLGSFVMLPLALLALSPLLSVWLVALYGVALALVHLDRVHVCRRSVRKTSGRYSKLTLGRSLLNLEGGPDFIGEIAKWSIIGTAGFAVFYSALPAMALMFWILTGMQIAPLDFRRIRQLAPAFITQDPVGVLTGAEVPLRQQSLIGAPEMTATYSNGGIRVDVRTLTRGLQQPDLTVREQRQIMAQIVAHAMAAVADIGPVRLFGPGQKASQADLEHLLITRTSRAFQEDPRALLDAAMHAPMLRDLLSCEAGDFPVFWDVRGRMDLETLPDFLDRAGLAHAGHLTMTHLTVFAGRRAGALTQTPQSQRVGA